MRRVCGDSHGRSSERGRAEECTKCESDRYGSSRCLVQLSYARLRKLPTDFTMFAQPMLTSGVEPSTV